MSERIKVRIEFTVELNRESWCLEYGIENSAKAIKEDVRRYIIGSVPYLAGFEASKGYIIKED